MKQDALERALLFDCYGEMLTEKQRTIFALHCDQDLSLGEIAEELGISRQGVHDNLARAEALLRNMEEKTGCVRRDRTCRKMAETIQKAALTLKSHPDTNVSALAEKILSAVRALEE